MKYVAIHHTAVSNNTQPLQLWAVNRYHQGKWNMKSSRGWYVGYNYFVERGGVLTLTRSIGEETIANKGHNCDIPERCDTISICMAGDFNKELPTKEQQQTVKKLIKTLTDTYQDIEIKGHRDLQANRTCPGLLITDGFLKDLAKEEPPEDAEKAQQIAELQSKLDYARLWITRLLQLLNKL